LACGDQCRLFAQRKSARMSDFGPRKAQ